MFGISFAEFVIIFLLILIVMGPEKIPEAARWAGKGLRELRKASNTLRNTLAMDELDFDAPSQTPRLPDEHPTAAGPAAGSGATDASNAETPEASSPPPRNDATSAPGGSEPTSPPATGLDQVDDQAFERMLEERYAAKTVGTHRVELSPPRDADDTIDAPLDPADGPDADTTAVDLAAPPTAEIAS